MAKMYKPNKITMSPNNETINQDVDANFSFVFNGEELHQLFVLVDTIYLSSPADIPWPRFFNPPKRNGELVTFSVPPYAGYYASDNMELKWSVLLLGKEYFITTTSGSGLVEVTDTSFSVQDFIRVENFSVFNTFDIYLRREPFEGENKYSVYNNYNAALSGNVSARITANSSGVYSVRAQIRSEEVPFRTASLPVFTLGAQNATSATQTVTPSYSHPQNYPMRNYIVEVYNDIGDLVYRSADIYSSNVSYTFNNLIDGENWFIRFYGYNTVEQYVDTGIIPVSVNYTPNITPLALEINGSNNCQHGRVDLLLETVGSTIILENGVYIDVTDVIIKRQEVGETTWETVAFLPFGVPEYHDYLASSGKSYIYRMYIYGVCRIVVNELVNPNTPFVDGAFYMIPNNMISPVVPVEYFGWFLVDLDGDKSYKIDVEFDGGEMKQEDDFTTYKTNVLYNTYSVGNTRHFVSSATGLISVDNLYNDFDNTNDVLEEIKNLISPSNRNRKLIKDRRRPTRIYPVFTYGYTEAPLNNAIGKQPYLCSFSWDQVDYEIK